MAAAYRVSQFVWHIRASVTGEEQRLARRQLPSPALFALFAGMPRADKRHALDVYLALRDRAYDDADLLAAALLHDVGKAQGIPLPHRVAIVLLRALAPATLRYLDQETSWWRRPFHISLHHPEIGARMIAEAGGNRRLVAFVRYHQNPPAGRDSLSAEDVALLETFHRVDDSY
ncbi:MAG: HD domain-containing protein [Chloroflexi bacterium]|nr:HD domain-containing protein [Chloroflexota bacterium]